MWKQKQFRTLRRQAETGIFYMVDVPIIAVVDDDIAVRLAIVGLVRAIGLGAHAFESAEKFLCSPQLAQTACLITDLQMPGMNGLELQSCLAARGHRFPIIIITAFPEQSIQERAEAAGAFAYLEKPFDGKRLVDLLQHALRGDSRPTPEMR
jgi:FixJ family two-component response regulator